MNREILQKIAEKWKEENLQIVLPYAKEQIKSAFDKIGKLVSKDIIQIYTTFGGIANEGIDSNLLSFWSLEQMIAENLKFKTDFALFGDFLIFSHLYGYKYENEDVSSVYCDFGTGKYLRTSDSVEEFFDLYLTNPTEVGLYKE